MKKQKMITAAVLICAFLSGCTALSDELPDSFFETDTASAIQESSISVSEGTELLPEETRNNLLRNNIARNGLDDRADIGHSRKHFSVGNRRIGSNLGNRFGGCADKLLRGDILSPKRLLCLEF